MSLTSSHRCCGVNTLAAKGQAGRLFRPSPTPKTPDAAGPLLRQERRVTCQAEFKERSDFESSPTGVKALVAGLTVVVNAVAGAFGSGGPGEEPVERPERPPITPDALAAGVEADFTENGYLWTGQISDELYDWDCVFTDPTLSFRGLDTFKRNIENLTPVLNVLLVDRDIELYSCELDEAEQCVVATWRMQGDLALPWVPRVELTGRTAFSYTSESKGRIVSYDETWDIPASEALAQILRVGPRFLLEQARQG